MKRAQLLFSLSTLALMATTVTSSPVFATCHDCIYGILENTDNAAAENNLSNPVVFAADGRLIVGDGLDLWYFKPTAPTGNYNYTWDQASGHWVPSTAPSAVTVGIKDVLLTAADNTGTVSFQGNSFVYGNVGALGRSVKQINGGADGTMVEFNDGIYYVDTVNFTGNGEIRFGLWSECGVGANSDGCNLTTNTVTTTHNGQGILSVYGDNNRIGTIGAPGSALGETHVHGTLTLTNDSYLGKVMYGGTINLINSMDLSFSTIVTGSSLMVTNIDANGKNLNLTNGLSLGTSSNNASNALLSLWGQATAAQPNVSNLTVRLGTGPNGTADYLSYNSLMVKGALAEASALGDTVAVWDKTGGFDAAVSALHANGERIVSNVGNWTFLLGKTTGGANLLYQRTSNTPHRDAGVGLDGAVYGGLIDTLEAAANAFNLNPAVPYSAGFETLLSKLELMSEEQRTTALQQLVDTSVNNSVTSSINGVGMQVSQAIAARKADALDVNLGINTGDETLGPRNNAWIQAIGSWNDQGRRKGIDGYQADTYGTALGFDRMIQDGTNLGIALHYANTRVDGKGVFSGNNTKINSYGITLYGQQSLTPELVLDGRLGYAYHDIRASRHSAILGERASGSWGGNQFDAAAKLGYTMTLPQNVAVTPNLGLAYTYLHEGAYTESGDGMALKVGSRATNALLIGGGVKGSKIFTTEGKTTITPELHGGVYYDALASSIDTTAQFVGGGSSFITRNAKPDPWVFNVGVGVKVATTDNLAFSVNYDAALRDQFVGHTASLKAKMTF